MNRLTTIEKVKSMTEPTDSFLLRLEDNIYGIRFKGFRIRNLDTGEIFHEFLLHGDITQLDYFANNELVYRFPNSILKSKNIGCNLTLVIDRPVTDLTLIERHYIDNNLIASYDFYFPKLQTENNIEYRYTIPKLSDETRKLLDYGEDILAKSDTFIFVEDTLVIHRRAKYTYVNNL